MNGILLPVILTIGLLEPHARIEAEVVPRVGTLADSFILEARVEAPPESEVLWPKLEETLGDFTIAEAQISALPEFREGRALWSARYTLVPERMGELELDPLPVTVMERNSGGIVWQKFLETEPLTVKVSSPLAEGASLDALRPLPEENDHSLAWGLAITLAAIAAVAASWLFFRRRSVVKPVAPMDQAASELDRLLASGLAERDIKAFYVELTGIVRRYLQRTTLIEAPQRTTEEFLHEIAQHPRFDDRRRKTLARFLEEADRVKYAQVRPRPEAVEASINTTVELMAPSGDERQ